ncbi:LysM peptidoglycan-binding domain-containing protein [Novosphingobium mangrovi (ex Huang et al. 2023)]|uniref:LysM peptidoglycan-binding domain-containing protein n=1 Tax=Novosphingobium mangrovi (ex Huang et al. 2023) TaxID=2976432 RepID=A0ABT2I4M5_9SPHN|nr:LysM peptidoglycan-binding domain-containing protein [Novosphingobium mangrovi (ex Huang et al. 2023)]MCT2399755.1 LysM peptidoglycan-binding domain-containing protein [Novosphingobium mangrovi (ex Huang et al. 2023)]
MKHAPLLTCAALVLAAPTMAVPALAAAANDETAHVVEQGETLNGIANRAGVSAEAIARANGLEPPYVVRIGQKLAIPRARAATRQSAPAATGFHVVEQGETLGGIARRAGVSAAALAKANGLEAPYIVRIGQKLQIPGTAPVRTASRAIETRQPSTPATATAPDQETVHVVAAGETLGGIAARAKVPRVLIAEANGLEPPFIVKVGQKLQIPRTRHYAVASGDTAFSISMKYGVPWEQIALANGMQPDAPVQAGQDLLIPTLLNPPPTGVSKLDPAPLSSAAASPAPVKQPRFGWPVNGPVRRGYATGSDYHDGLDIKAAKGTMVRAAAAGTVKFAGKEKEQFGNLVVIDHGDGWFTAYGFLSRITVKEGARVAAGERIGLVGSTGLAKGDELHFEVRQNGKPVDPLDELPKAP